MIAPKKIAVVGGGISGLATAYYLSELTKKESLPHEVTVFEAGDRFGGVIETNRQDGFLLEGGPESFVAGKPWALDLCKRLGMGEETIETRQESRYGCIYRKGRLFRIPQGLYLFAPTRGMVLWNLPLMSWRGKLRMACEAFVPARKDETDESIGNFVRRRFGRETLESIAEPLLGGIFAGDVNHLSIKAILPHFRELEMKHGSVIRAFLAKRFQGEKSGERDAGGPRYAIFRSLKNGMGSFVTKLIQAMPQVKLQPSSPIKAIYRKSCWEIVLVNGRRFEADVICLALPSYEAAKLLSPIFREIASSLESIPYESAAVVNLAFRKEDLAKIPEGFGFVTPLKEGDPILSCSFSSNKFPGRAPEDCFLARVFLGGSRDPKLLERDDKEIAKLTEERLRPVLGARRNSLFAVVTRQKKALPQYYVRHMNRVNEIERKLQCIPGLFLTGNAYRGIGVPDCIHQSAQTAKAIFNYVTV